MPINLIKNVVRMVNNIEFFKHKINGLFLLFQACYLHDISMVIHPNIASFNESNPDSEVLISQWMDEMLKIENDVTRTFKEDHFSLAEIFQLRKKIGRLQVEAFQKVSIFLRTRSEVPIRKTALNTSEVGRKESCLIFQKLKLIRLQKFQKVMVGIAYTCIA